MSKTAPKSKSAMETLVDSFGDLVADAKERMSAEELRKAEKEFDEIINKAKARASCGLIAPRNPFSAKSNLTRHEV
jgi:hypothetical protein